MLTKNIDVLRGLVNGARGVVKEFEATKGTYPYTLSNILSVLIIIIDVLDSISLLYKT